MSTQEVTPVVSICCVTYNHGSFIGQALDGFLMQKTTFPFEIIIGNDCSTDNTQAILDEYAAKYPDKIRLLIAEKNVGVHQNLINIAAACKGKYIAICEGDDYWTDPYKLQKQADFLENNPDYVICCHYTRVVNDKGETLYVHPKPTPLQYSYRDLLVGRQAETKTGTVMYHNLPELFEVFNTPWWFKCYAGDKMFKLYSTLHTGKKVYVLPEVMSCYRNHVGGVWSMIDAKKRMNMMISDFNLIVKYFTYNTLEKKGLLLLYIQRYLLFEIRSKKYHKAFLTIKSLL